MNSSSPHELEDFMQQVTTEMESEYLRIRSRASEDPGTAGDQGEEKLGRTSSETGYRQRTVSSPREES